MALRPSMVLRDRLGGGVQYSITNPGSGTPIVHDMVFHDGFLYISGQFQYAGGIYAQNVARYDGLQWCSFGNTFDVANTVWITFWRDELYMAGEFNAINGIPMHGVAHWTGGLGAFECTENNIGVAVQEPSGGLQVIELAPAEFRIVLPTSSTWTCSLVDALGKALELDPVNGQEVLLDLRDRATGMYLFRCVDGIGNVQFAKLLRN